MASAEAVEKFAAVYESFTENPKVRIAVGNAMVVLGKTPGLIGRCVAAFLEVSGRTGDDRDIRIQCLESLARLADAMPVALQRKSFVVTKSVLSDVSDDVKLRVIAVQALALLANAGGASTDEASEVLADIASSVSDAEDVRVAAAEFAGRLS